MVLTSSQNEYLDKVLSLCTEASCDLSDSISNGRMSDSKSSVFAIKTALNAEKTSQMALPSSLSEIANEAWSCVISGGDTYSRAASAIGQVGILERAIAELRGEGV